MNDKNLNSVEFKLFKDFKIFRVGAKGVGAGVQQNMHP